MRESLAHSHSAIELTPRNAATAASVAVRHANQSVYELRQTPADAACVGAAEGGAKHVT